MPHLIFKLKNEMKKLCGAKILRVYWAERDFLPKCGINGHDWYGDNNNRGCQVRTPDVTGGNHSCQFKMESESVDGENKGPKDHANITYEYAFAL